MKAWLVVRVLPLLLAACSGPEIAAFNDQGGVISYHIVNSNLNDVMAIAERYCARDGRKAKLAYSGDTLLNFTN
jgi:hypothetical protein